MKALWNKTKNWLNTNNHLLWVSISALIVIGVVAMYFICPYYDARLHMESGTMFGKSVPFFIAGCLLLFICSHLSKRWLLRASLVLGMFGLLLMLNTIFAPEIINGSARYVRFCSAYLDPFAITLPAYIVLMSYWLSKERTKWIAPITIILSLFIILAAIHAPYVFMAQIYFLVFLVMGFCARKNNPNVFRTSMVILIVFVALFLLSFFGWHHVQQRIFNLDVYASHMSIQTMKASVLIGNTPESLTAMSQIPYFLSDFMFTSMIAKFGFLMGGLVLLLYVFVANGLTKIIRNTKDQFVKILSSGTLAAFAVYIIMGICVAFGILATAAYWPFISFGGTMFLMWCILFGFVLSQNKK